MQFALETPDGRVPRNRFMARSFYFDQSIFSYAEPNKGWWGYA